MKITAITPSDAGLTTDVAETLFDDVARFASYGFNKSHAAAYASISFQTASLKAHHPEAFFAASMNMALDTVEDIALFAGDLAKRKIPLLPPHINSSTHEFYPVAHPEGLAIRYALTAVRGVGGQCAKDIVAERKNGLFASFQDFRDRMGAAVNKKALTSLIHAGALDGLIASRADAIALAENRRSDAVNQLSFFDTVGVDTRETLPEYDTLDRLNNEFDVLGFWHSGHPLHGMGPQLRKAGLSSLRALTAQKPVPKSTWLVAGVLSQDTRGTKSGGMMGLLQLSDSMDVYEVVAFDETWASIRSVCKKKALVALQVTVIDEDGDLRLMVQQAVPLENKLKRQAA